MNLEKTCEFICEQIRIDKTIRDDKSIDAELVCECAHPHVVLKKCLEAIEERKRPFMWR